jgi:hypothetical protein
MLIAASSLRYRWSGISIAALTAAAIATTHLLRFHLLDATLLLPLIQCPQQAN